MTYRKYCRQSVSVLAGFLLAASLLTAGCGSDRTPVSDTSLPESGISLPAEESQADSEPESGAEAAVITLTKSIDSADGSMRLQFPDNWSDMSGFMSTDGSVEAAYPLRAGCPEEAAFLLACCESREGSILSDVRDYTETLVQGMTASSLFSDVQMGQLTPISLGRDSLSGYIAQFTADSQAGRVAYTLYTAETETAFYQICCWTSNAGAGSEEAVFDTIAGSFEVLS